MQVDGQPASARAVEQRLAQFWFETEPVVYIGQTGRNTVRGRVSLRGSSVKNIREHDVIIRIFGDFAIIHARTMLL